MTDGSSATAEAVALLAELSAEPWLGWANRVQRCASGATPDRQARKQHERAQEKRNNLAYR